MKTINSLLAAAAAVLLQCLPFTPASAQALSVSPTSLSWSATDTSERPALVSADYGVTWTVSGYGTSFIVDTTEGEGMDFIHVQPAGVNPGTADITAILTISDGTSSCQLSLAQFGSGEDPTERIDLSGNWTIERTYTNSGGTASFEDITFYDGLGYPEQIVQVGASPVNSRNIVTPVWYDVMRRDDARSYLPYVSTSTGRAEESTSTVLSSQAAWYNSSGWSGQGAYAFSEQEYEQSPLNRVLKARKPGSTYAKTVSGSKYANLSYAANDTSEVRKLTVSASGALVLSGGYYPAGTLHKTTAADEDGSVSVTWTDVLGHTVLSRQTANSQNLDTYYVYDDAGQLRWVVTPEGSAAIVDTCRWALNDGTGITDVNSSKAARYCYIYTWDGLGRQLSRKIPGKAVEHFVYDRAGRLVMTQDGLQRSSSKWVTMRYDNAGRLIRRALLTSSRERTYFQNLFHDSNFPSVVYPDSGDTLLESFDYGTYLSASAAGLNFEAVSGIVTASDVDMTRTTGLKTYEKTAVMPGTGTPSTYVQRAYYYDALGRLVQTVEKDAANIVSRYSTGYDFLGNVTASREQHGSDYKSSTFTYDSRGRLLSESTDVNGAVTATMAYAYDPLGRPKTTTSGSGSTAVTTTDTYNIQGWLTARSAQKSGGTNVFSMNLGYYSPVQSGAAPRYSGDISSWTWTQSGQGQKAYAYTYDGAHRLTAGQYYSGGSATNALSEKGIEYDCAGNITTLTQYSSSGSATTLSYTYTGNRRSTFAYDVNGNVTNDATSSLQTSYNLLNFPVQTKSGTTVKANYSYLSDGTKASVLNASGAGYDYNGTFTYSHASGGARTLESVAFGGGRIRKNGSSYAVDYYVTDHLGSVRAIVNASGAIVEQNDFYPFGTRQQNGLTTLSANRWRFSGKEGYDSAFGIAWDDFGARRYDRTAWTSIDPLAEKYYSLSPYAYCAGNPVSFVDPDGDWAHVAIGAAVGAAVNGVVAIAQHKSGREVFAAAAGGAVEGAITAATGGLNLYARVGVGIAASVAGDVIEQKIGTGNVTGREVASSAVAGIFSSVFSNIVSDGIDVLSKSAIIKVDKKYASEEVQHLIRKEVKKEAYSAGKTLGSSTKQWMRREISDRVKNFKEVDKANIEAANKIANEINGILIDYAEEKITN